MYFHVYKFRELKVRLVGRCVLQFCNNIIIAMLHHVWPVFKIKIEFFWYLQIFIPMLDVTKSPSDVHLSLVDLQGTCGRAWLQMILLFHHLFHYSGINTTNFFLLGLGNRKANLAKFHTPRPCTYMWILRWNPSGNWVFSTLSGQKPCTRIS